jgi:hypothetical protein
MTTPIETLHADLGNGWLLPPDAPREAAPAQPARRRTSP